MKCKKCGKDTLIKKDDWYECAYCGALIFDTDITVNNISSPSKQVARIEEELAFSSKADMPDDRKKGGIEKKSKKALNLKINVKKSKHKDSNADNDNDKSKKKKSKTREIIEFLIPIFVALILSIILKNVVFANAIVPTGSMLNTIQEGDRIVANRLAYVTDEPERYDIVIFYYPDDESKFYVKRVIGLPGETITIDNGKVYATTRDGEYIMLDDSFITNCVPTGNFGPYVVPEGHYFMMGDNRNSSWDSRYWTNKYVSEDKIIGKVKFRYYPSLDKIE